jgi:hypothetical protein
VTDPTARPEVDDPRVHALAKARQQIAYESPFNFVCPPWDGLTEEEQHLSLLDARNYLHAALKAGLLAAPAVPAPAADRAALRDRIIAALDNAHHTHPCPALGDQTWSGCVHYDEAGRVVGVGSCHSGRRADAVLAVLPAPTDRAASPGAFVLWLDASDGSVPTHDGIQWPDGTVTIHHRHFGITTTHHSAEAACQAAHGKQGRIVWPERAPTDRAAVLHEAADRITRQADQLWAPGTRAHTVMYADAAELRRMADEAQQDGAGQVVAYRSLGGRILRCLNHIPPDPDGDFTAVTSDDLPDGGICTYPACGVDVLIQQPATEAQQSGESR